MFLEPTFREREREMRGGGECWRRRDPPGHGVYKRSRSGGFDLSPFQDFVETGRQQLPPLHMGRALVLALKDLGQVLPPSP